MDSLLESYTWHQPGNQAGKSAGTVLQAVQPLAYTLQAVGDSILCSEPGKLKQTVSSGNVIRSCLTWSILSKRWNERPKGKASHGCKA